MKPSCKSRSKITVVSILVPLVVVILALSLKRIALLLQQLTPLHRSNSHRTATMSYAREHYIACLAVQRATLLTQRVFHEKVKGTELKNDKSPVTIGDYGAQALVIAAIKHAFPSDKIVGEEESSDLRENTSLRSQVWTAVKDARLAGPADSELGGPLKNEEDMLKAIDEGGSAGGAKGRFWALDPIDGTKGFLRGGQYAVCLALIVDGELQVGVLGCPNLPVDDTAPLSADISDPAGGKRGVIFAAIRGEGATSQSLGTGALEPSSPIHLKSPTLADATFCESLEAGHSAHGEQAEIAKKLGITKPSVRMDSQAKYGSVARGAGDIYLRLPVNKTYQEKVWDHAAGDLIVRAAELQTRRDIDSILGPDGRSRKMEALSWHQKHYTKRF